MSFKPINGLGPVLTSLLKHTNWQVMVSLFVECTGTPPHRNRTSPAPPQSLRGLFASSKTDSGKNRSRLSGPGPPYMSALTKEANMPSSCPRRVSGLSYSMMLPRFITMTRSAVTMVWTRCCRHTGTTQHTRV